MVNVNITLTGLKPHVKQYLCTIYKYSIEQNYANDLALTTTSKFRLIRLTRRPKRSLRLSPGRGSLTNK